MQISTTWNAMTKYVQEHEQRSHLVPHLEDSLFPFFKKIWKPFSAAFPFTPGCLKAVESQIKPLVKDDIQR